MKKRIHTIVCLLLALVLAAGMTGCGRQADPAPEQAEVNLYVLAGPTGIGAMNLWAAAEAGET